MVADFFEIVQRFYKDNARLGCTLLVAEALDMIVLIVALHVVHRVLNVMKLQRILLGQVMT